MQKITEIIGSFIGFINGTLVPLIFALAFIVFLWGVFKYFIQGAANPEQRGLGAQFIMYSLGGFFIMISVWGLVNLLVGTFNLDSNGRPCLPTFGKDANCNGSSGAGTPENILPPGQYDPNAPGQQAPGDTTPPDEGSDVGNGLY